jgi:hypothetical protein
MVRQPVLMRGVPLQGATRGSSVIAGVDAGLIQGFPRLPAVVPSSTLIP